MAKTIPPQPPNNFAPVRWLVGEVPLLVNPKDFNAENSKSSRPLQPLDGRIMLQVTSTHK